MPGPGRRHGRQMTLRIAHNVDAVGVQRHLALSTDRLAVAMKRLSSGMRINSAADDASGLGISERLRGQIRGLDQANRNIQDGISMLNTMEAALQTVHSILQRGRELAVQFNNGVYDFAQKGAILSELTSSATRSPGSRARPNSTASSCCRTRSAPSPCRSAPTRARRCRSRSSTCSVPVSTSSVRSPSSRCPG